MSQLLEAHWQPPVNETEQLPVSGWLASHPYFKNSADAARLSKRKIFKRRAVRLANRSKSHEIAS
jgi:hypothetical protein